MPGARSAACSVSRFSAAWPPAAGRSTWPACTRRSSSPRSRSPPRPGWGRSSARRGRSWRPSPHSRETDDILPLVEPEPELPAEAAGTAPGRGRLEGKRVLVVGAGRMPNDDPDSPPGNGQATSVLAAREGAAVAVADLRPEAADETVALVEQAGGRAVRIVADVGEV